MELFGGGGVQSGSRHANNSTVLKECEELEAVMQQTVGDLNPYGLDWPVCNDPITRHGRSQRHALLSRLARARGRSSPDEKFLPCEEVRARRRRSAAARTTAPPHRERAHACGES